MLVFPAKIIREKIMKTSSANFRLHSTAHDLESSKNIHKHQDHTPLDYILPHKSNQHKNRQAGGRGIFHAKAIFLRGGVPVAAVFTLPVAIIGVLIGLLAWWRPRQVVARKQQ